MDIVAAQETPMQIVLSLGTFGELFTNIALLPAVLTATGQCIFLPTPSSLTSLKPFPINPTHCSLFCELQFYLKSAP